MERIKYSCYRYAPETTRVTVNGESLDVSGTSIPTMICCGNKDKAIEEIKRLFRKEKKKETRYVYAFFEKGGKKFHYISALNFHESDGINEKLYCYKELKHYLMNNPLIINVESGHITPYGTTKPQTKTQKIELDFTKLGKFKIVFN